MHIVTLNIVERPQNKLARVISLMLEQPKQSFLPQPFLQGVNTLTVPMATLSLNVTQAPPY